MQIYDLLGSIADKIIINVTNPNGLDILYQLEDYFIDIDTSVVNHQLLQQEFETMKRNNNKSYQQFATGFLKKRQELLELNKVNKPTGEATLADKFLRGLNGSQINTEICLELATKTPW